MDLPLHAGPARSGWHGRGVPVRDLLGLARIPREATIRVVSLERAGAYAVTGMQPQYWLAASVLAHDAILAPIAFSLCWAGARLQPARTRPWAAGAIFACGAAFLVTLPALVQAGRDPNPTVLPLDYGRNIVVVILLVIGITIAAASIAGAARGGWRAPGRARVAPHEGTEHHENDPPPAAGPPI